MKLKLTDLKRSLDQGLRGAYLVFGDEPLLLEEAVDLIRQKALNAGFSERHRVSIDAKFDPADLQNLAQNQSLFGAKLIELQLPAKPSAALAQALPKLIETAGQDYLLLAHGPKFESAVQKSAWCQAFDSHGIQLLIYALESQDLAAWLQTRAKNLGLKLDPDALAYLSHCTEGNLLAGSQCLQKLSLEYAQQTINLELMESVLEDQSRYGLFELTRPLLLQQSDKAWHILQKLEQEDVEPTLLLWSLTKEFRQIYQIHQKLNQKPLSAIFQELYIWPKRQPEIQSGLKLIPAPKALHLLQQCAKIDLAIKGATNEDPWFLFREILGLIFNRPT